MAPLMVRAHDAMGAADNIEEEIQAMNKKQDHAPAPPPRSRSPVDEPVHPKRQKPSHEAYEPLTQPRITEPLQDMRVEEGSPVTLRCGYDAPLSAPVHADWLKDGITVDSPDYKTRLGPHEASLTIDETFADDSANYKCRLSNQVGTAETIARLTVYETHNLPKEAPDFTRGLRSMTVTEGDPLQLDCAVTGEPQPQVHWFRDDINIDASPDYLICYVTGLCSLKVREAGPQHAARFRCQAVNSAGEAVTTARVNVVPLQRPRITRGLGTQCVDRGEEARFDVRFEGRPAPEIFWLKDNTALIEEPANLGRRKVHRDPLGGTSLLTLERAQLGR